MLTDHNQFWKIQNALQRATCDSSSQVGAIFQVLQTKESPPTYFRTNKFTSAFQEIVDAYGLVLHSCSFIFLATWVSRVLPFKVEEMALYLVGSGTGIDGGYPSL